ACPLVVESIGLAGRAYRVQAACGGEIDGYRSVEQSDAGVVRNVRSVGGVGVGVPAERVGPAVGTEVVAFVGDDGAARDDTAHEAVRCRDGVACAGSGGHGMVGSGSIVNLDQLVVCSRGAAQAELRDDELASACGERGDLD